MACAYWVTAVQFCIREATRRCAGCLYKNSTRIATPQITRGVLGPARDDFVDDLGQIGKGVDVYTLL
jgi:hypothetical protein